MASTYDRNENVINLRFAEAVRRVAGWEEDRVFPDDRNTGDLYVDSGFRPDMLLTLPDQSPIVVECKKLGVPHDPVVKARQSLGLTLSEHAGAAQGEKITKALAVRHPPAAGSWQESEMVDNLLASDEIRWKYVKGESPDSSEEWPNKGYLKGTVEDFVGSVENSSADVAGIVEAGGKIAALIGGGGSQNVGGAEKSSAGD